MCDDLEDKKQKFDFVIWVIFVVDLEEQIYGIYSVVKSGRD